MAAALSGGVDRVQVRARELGGAALVELVATLAAAARRESPAAEILVNRRVDAALAAGADGVHLGFDAVTPAEARRLLPAGVRIGVSCHAPEEVAAAAAAGADYAHLAPIFDPLSKPRERPALGLDALAASASHGIPVLAQGGIEADNAGAAIAAGAAGVAVTGAILAAPDPRAAAVGLRAALG